MRHGEECNSYDENLGTCGLTKWSLEEQRKGTKLQSNFTPSRLVSLSHCEPTPVIRKVYMIGLVEKYIPVKSYLDQTSITMSIVYF